VISRPLKQCTPPPRQSLQVLNSALTLNIVEPVMRPAKPAETESAKRESSASAEQQKKKRKIETVAVGRKPAAQLEKWATKRQELKGESQQPTTTTTTVTVTEQGVSQFADLNQMCCLLCKRKFQSVEEIQKHERISKLHKVRSSSFPI
jgi:RNA-binding protein 5/10